MSREELEDGLYHLFLDLYSQEKFHRRKRHYMEIVRSLKQQTLDSFDAAS